MPPWNVARADAWYQRQPWLCGFNYVPSYAANTTEWWQAGAFDAAVIERELRWAAAIGYNTTRVFLQYLVWKQDPNALKERFAGFLRLAGQSGIRVMPVLFDDCAFGDPLQLDPFLGAQRDPIPGMILPSWTPSPGRRLAADPGERRLLRQYVLDLLGNFGHNPHVLLWDLFNEPMHAAGVGTPAFLSDVFTWAGEAGATQPLTVGIWWNEDQLVMPEVVTSRSDIITFHAYADRQGLARRISELRRFQRPLICTEWMARVKGSRFDQDLSLFRVERVGCYQWGLVNGRTQCQFPWWNKAGGAVDPQTGWFHDILHTDGTPYRQQEVDAIKAILRQN